MNGLLWTIVGFIFVPFSHTFSIRNVFIAQSSCTRFLTNPILKRWICVAKMGHSRQHVQEPAVKQRQETNGNQQFRKVDLWCIGLNNDVQKSPQEVGC